MNNEEGKERLLQCGAMRKALHTKSNMRSYANKRMQVYMKNTLKTKKHRLPVDRQHETGTISS